MRKQINSAMTNNFYNLNSNHFSNQHLQLFFVLIGRQKAFIMTKLNIITLINKMREKERSTLQLNIKKM
jgi:hypothetical protein